MNNKNPFRSEKINSLVFREITPVIAEYARDIGDYITVTRCETTKDNKTTRVFISAISNNADRALNLLKKNIYDIQGHINSKLKMKITPRIEFYYDETPKFASNIEQKIKEALDT